MRPDRPVRIFVMDLWSLVPYYTIALAQSVSAAGTAVTIGSIGYDLDPECFTRAGIRNDGGLVDVLSRTRIANAPLRRILKLLQGILNLVALSVRFLIARPDIVHIQQLRLIRSPLPVELWFLRFARVRGCRLVYTVHNVLPHDSGSAHRVVYGRLYSFVHALICHSEDSRDRLIAEFGVRPEKMWVIPHGPLFQPASGRNEILPPKSGFVVLWQGFVRPYKGVEFLLNSWAELVRRRTVPEARLVIAGTGDARYIGELQDLVNRLGISDSVEMQFRFVDADELSTLYRAADVVVYPYREITTSGALMTGIGNEKAIIATDLGAFRELLTDGENALLVPYGDTNALAGAIECLLRDRELRARLAAAVAVLNRRCSWTLVGERTRECYAHLLSARPAGKVLHARTF